MKSFMLINNIIGKEVLYQIKIKKNRTPYHDCMEYSFVDYNMNEIVLKT